MRQEPLFHPHEKDHGKLEPLDHVQSDQRHALAAVVHGVNVAHQRDIFQKCLQAFTRR